MACINYLLSEGSFKYKYHLIVITTLNYRRLHNYSHYIYYILHFISEAWKIDNSIQERKKGRDKCPDSFIFNVSSQFVSLLIEVDLS